MKEKIHNAILDMMKKVEFAEDGHTYRDTTTDTWLQGVSSVSSIIPKEWLSAWGAKEAVKFLGYSDYEGDTELAQEMMKKISELKTPEEFIALLKEAKGASSRKSKTALVDGKEGHAWLESYVKAKIRGQEPPTPATMLERPLKQFLEWELKNVSEWILAEARVAYPEKKYAGTLDAMAIMKNGALAIIDFKFASNVSSDYKLQTAGYQATFEPYGIEIDERIVIRLPKTLEKEEYNKEERKYYMIPNNIEPVTYTKDTYEWDRDTFFHALPLKKWINNELNNNK